MSSQEGSDQLPEHVAQLLKLDENTVGFIENSGSNYTHRDVFNHHGSPSGINQGYQGHQGHQGQHAFNPVVGSGRTLEVGSQTLGARRGSLPTPIAPPARRSPLQFSPHSSLLSQPVNQTTPTRSGSGYLEHITPLRFPHGQPTPSRRLSFPHGQPTPSCRLNVPSTPNLAYSKMHNAAQGSGDVIDNSSSEDNGGVSTIIGFQNTGGASMGVNSQGNGGVSVHIDSQDIGAASMSDTIQSNAGAVMNDTIQSNEGAAMNDTIQSNVGAITNDTIQSNVGAVTNVAPDDAQATPRGIPSQVQLPVNRQLVMNQPFVHHRVHGGGGLRRMSSNPVMASRPMFNPAPGVGPVHMPSHPAPTAPAPPAVYVDPVTDEVNEFLNTL